MCYAVYVHKATALMNSLGLSPWHGLGPTWVSSHEVPAAAEECPHGARCELGHLPVLPLNQQGRTQLLYKPWHRLPIEVEEASSQQTLKARLDVILGYLIYLKMSVLIAGGWI